MKKIKFLLFIPILFFAFNSAYSGDKEDIIREMINEFQNEEFSTKPSTKHLKSMILVLENLNSNEEAIQNKIKELKKFYFLKKVINGCQEGVIETEPIIQELKKILKYLEKLKNNFYSGP